MHKESSDELEESFDEDQETPSTHKPPDENEESSDDSSSEDEDEETPSTSRSPDEDEDEDEESSDEDGETPSTFTCNRCSESSGLPACDVDFYTETSGAAFPAILSGSFTTRSSISFTFNAREQESAQDATGSSSNLSTISGCTPKELCPVRASDTAKPGPMRSVLHVPGRCG